MDIDGRRARVLYVEDDEASAEFVRGVLEQAGYACSTAVDAAAGLNAILSGHVDLLLTDLGLPGINGVQFLRVLRALDINVPTIVMTAHGREDFIRGVVPYGVRRYLVKPLEAKQVLREVAEAMPRHTTPYLLRVHPEDVRSRADKTSRQFESGRAEADEAKEPTPDSARALLEIANMRESFSGSHGARVTEYARALATKAKLPQSSLPALEVAALLHDIGKISLPERLMAKRLNGLKGEDLKIAQRHSEVGAAIMERMTAGKNIATTVRAHHENFDGTGFPDGLAGYSIPIEARIVAVADAMDRALISSEGKASDFVACRAALRSAKGLALDPKLTDYALTLVDELEVLQRPHLSVSVGVTTLVGGEVLAEDIRGEDGSMYLPRNSVITDRYREGLRRLARGKRGHKKVLIYKSDAQDGHGR